MIKYLSVHHSGPAANDPHASTQHHTVAIVDAHHKQRWPDFKSSLGYYCGYTLIILPNGKLVQTRLVGEEGAHTIGFNKTSIGVLVMGNFTNGSPDTPTYQQKKTLSDIGQACLKGAGALRMMGILTTMDAQVDITLARIVPHRQLNPGHTECFGSKLPNDWARTVVMAGQNPESIDELKLTLMQEIVRLSLQVLDLLRARSYVKVTLGAINDRGCITN